MRTRAQVQTLSFRRFVGVSPSAESERARERESERAIAPEEGSEIAERERQFEREQRTFLFFQVC